MCPHADAGPAVRAPAGAARAHEDWRRTLRDAERLVREDEDLRLKAAKGLALQERYLPPEVIGRLYAQYCRLVNRLYDAYICNLQLQKLPYIQEIIKTFTRRVYELRNELVQILVSDYVFVDAALAQLHLTPQDIEILVPFHFPLELRPASLEGTLQELWAEGERRRRAPPAPPPRPAQPAPLDDDDLDYQFAEPEPEQPADVEEEPMKTLLVKEKSEAACVPTDSYLMARFIQQHEKYRQFHIPHNRMKLAYERMLRGRPASPPLSLKVAAAECIQHCYRAFMAAKRKLRSAYKRDLMLGMIMPSYSPGLNRQRENIISDERRMAKKQRLMETYLEEFEKEKARLVVWKRDGVIDDITAHVREWFLHWYQGYVLPLQNQFPEFPVEADGGTVLVIREDFDSIEERIDADEHYKAAMKGKTKDMLKAEKAQEKLDAAMRLEEEIDRRKKEAEALFKMRCDPRADPGHTPYQSQSGVAEALRNYQLVWKNADRIPPERFLEMAYGHMKSLITEDIMNGMHRECRMYVDEFMRLELQLLVNALKAQYKIWGYKYPKEKKRKPPVVKLIKSVEMDDANREKITMLFEKEIVQKPPLVKVQDVVGDYNFHAYDCYTKDPDASFPLPSYGDVRRRLLLSCAWGACPHAGAARRRSVLLLGPPAHGKTFLVDAVCGELNAVKLDISPEVFNGQFPAPARMLATVALAAKLLQPAVIYLADIERVFSKKVPPEMRAFKPGKLKKALGKVLMKSIAAEDKVIFIATCSDPTVAAAKPMARLFEEVILVPRTDYNTAQWYLHCALMSLHGVPREFCAQPIAQMLQGYGLGTIMSLFDEVMTPARIVRLNVEPLRPEEFLEPLIMAGVEPYSLEDYQVFVDWYVKNTHLGKKREEYDTINTKRAAVYAKVDMTEEES